MGFGFLGELAKLRGHILLPIVTLISRLSRYGIQRSLILKYLLIHTILRHLRLKRIKKTSLVDSGTVTSSLPK